MLPTKDDSLTCYVNEEGLMKNLPKNPWSRFLIEIGVRIAPNTPIAGNIVVLGGPDEYGEETSVTTQVLEYARQRGEEQSD